MSKPSLETKEIRNTVDSAQNDIRVAFAMLLYGDVITEQSKIDALYDYLGTAKVQIGSVMNKIRPHTTYYKETDNE